MIARTTETETSQVINPAHQTWLLQDQLVLSTLLSSLDSRSPWPSFVHDHIPRGVAGQIRRQLAGMRKKEGSIVEYFNTVKKLIDTLAPSASHFRVQNEEIVTYVLTGFGSRLRRARHLRHYKARRHLAQ